MFTSKGIWLNAGNFEMHIGVEDGVDRSKTRGTRGVRSERHRRAGERRSPTQAMRCNEQPMIPGYDRFQFRDPFGNNIELIREQA